MVSFPCFRGMPPPTDNHHSQSWGSCYGEVERRMSQGRGEGVNFREGRTWAIAVRRGSYESLFLLNSGHASLEKKGSLVFPSAMRRDTGCSGSAHAACACYPRCTCTDLMLNIVEVVRSLTNFAQTFCLMS